MSPVSRKHIERGVPQHHSRSEFQCAVPDRCPIAQTKAATALTSDSDNAAPPFGGMVPSDCLGAGTPLSIVAVSASRLPSPHSHLPRVRSGPTVLPLASEPWQPLQVPAETSPRKIR